MSKIGNRETFNIAVKPEVGEFIRAQAQADGRSISNYINMVFEDIMETVNLDELEDVDNPAKRLSIVVLPHPLGPNKHTNSPSFISKLMFFKASCPLS